MHTHTTDAEILGRVAVEMLERFAFLLGDPQAPDTPPPELPSQVWLVTLVFTGPRTGTLGMCASPELARQMAANLFGMEPGEVSSEQAVDALKELLNVACGDYLHELDGDTAVYDLSAPAFTTDEREALCRRLEGKPRAMLNVEGEPLFIFLGT